MSDTPRFYGAPIDGCWLTVSRQNVRARQASLARYGLTVAHRPDDVPSDPAVVVLNPDADVTAESFAAWLDRCQVGEPVDPGVRAADILAEARAAAEV